MSLNAGMYINLYVHPDAAALAFAGISPPVSKTCRNNAMLGSRSADSQAHLVVGINPHHWHGHQPHCARHTIAVLVQLIKGVIPRLEE
eukprot:scaffold136150_cov24-Tisochrysis_lutea.AAC.1